jgi:integrase
MATILSLRQRLLDEWAITSAAEIPRSITWDEVRRMLEAVDRRTAAGKRDYAILLLLVTFEYLPSPANSELRVGFRPTKPPKPHHLSATPRVRNQLTARRRNSAAVMPRSSGRSST